MGACLLRARSSGDFAGQQQAGRMTAPQPPAVQPPQGTNSFLREITPLIITFNEIDNIRRTLAALDWATRIVVVDSGSTDGTLDILGADTRIHVHIRTFDNFAAQCQAGLALIDTGWALSLDADYELTSALIAEIADLNPQSDIDGYAIRFTYCIHGYPLRGTLYPPRVSLYRTRRAKYAMEGHGHRVTIPGHVSKLACFIRHDDRKPLGRWLQGQARYAEQESQHLLSARWSALRWPDRIRMLLVVAPWLVPLYCLIVKRGLLDGLPGWYYALQRGIAETVLALRLIETKLGVSAPAAHKES